MKHGKYHNWLSTAPVEIQDLFRQWKHDPCWDLYETSGFEDHADALYGLQLEHELDRALDELDRHRAMRRLLSGWLSPTTGDEDHG